MSEASRIRKNSLFSFFSMSSRLITNIIIYWIIARYYGREIFGQFTSAQTIAIALILFADFGLDLLLTTELPRDIKNSVTLFNNFFSIKIIFSSIAFLAMILLGLFGRLIPEVKTLLLIFSFFVVFTTLSNFLSALYKGNEKLEYETFVNFIINFSSLIVILTLIFLKQNIIVLSVAFTFTKFIGLVSAFYFAHKLISLKNLRIDFSFFPKYKNQIIIFGLFWVFGNLFFQLDTILLTFWSNTENVGVYQAVFRLIMLPLVIPDIFVNSLMPTLSRLNSENRIKWEKLGNIFNKLLIIVAVPISISLFIFPEQVIHLVYGRKEYADAIPILKVFAVILFIRFFSETHGLMLTTSHRQNQRMKIVLAATILNFVINLFLIPRFGAFGASITSLITNFSVCILYIISTSPVIFDWVKEWKIFQFLFLVICLAVVGYIFRYLNLWLVFALPFVFYLVAAYKLVLSSTEKKYFSEMEFLTKFVWLKKMLA